MGSSLLFLGGSAAAAAAAATAPAQAVSPPPRTPRISLRGVTLCYGRTVALDRVDLDVAAGEALVLLGPSGSGKTTILRCIAGFSRPSEGRVALSGRDVTEIPPHGRGLGMVVQNYALFPHMRVAENVGFGLRARGRRRTEIAGRVADSLALVGMAAFARRYPRELSGGQQQRVAIARALAIDPPVLLLDEPLSALDAPLRAGLLDEIRNLHARLPQLAIVYVTHDQSEAIALGHRIVLMRDGRIAAQGAPRDLHDSPPDRYTAEFFGQANLLPVAADDGAAPAGLVAVRLGGRRVLARARADGAMPRSPLLCIRPHDLHLDRAPALPEGTVNTVEARIVSAQWLGTVQRVQATIGDDRVRIDLPGGAPPPRIDTVCAVRFAPERASLVEAG